MGGAARWFKGLFRKKKRFVSSDDFDKGGEDSDNCNFPTDPVCLRHFLTDTEKEQNKHAIAVATATATAAKAAVSAAKAAAAVVRLTSERKAGNIITREEERWAAVKIQKVFRGSLARKALRALKAIVKLQALVRGYLVRKRAAAILQSIQALIRVQTAMRSKRNRCLSKDYTSMFQPRHSHDKFDEVSPDERRPKIVEIDDIFKRRSKSRQIHNDAAMSEYEDGFVYEGNALELCLSKEKWKFEMAHNTPRFSSSSKFSTAQNTPRFSSSSHQHNRYYVQSPSRSVCGNPLCDYGVRSPGYMERTQSFKAKQQRSHSAPHRRSERQRLSLDEVIESRSSVSVESLLQQEQQRYSCS